jgi:hypothetical protein
MHTLACWVSPKRLQEQHSERINKTQKHTPDHNNNKLQQTSSRKLGKRKTGERRAKVKTTHFTRKERKKEREDQEEED